jgi:hypothetical protein
VASSAVSTLIASARWDCFVLAESETESETASHTNFSNLHQMKMDIRRTLVPEIQSTNCGVCELGFDASFEPIKKRKN